MSIPKVLAIVVGILVSVFVFWNFFPLTEMKISQDGSVTFQAPGIYIKQNESDTSTDGITKIDYARMNFSSYKSLRKAAESYQSDSGENYFSDAIKEVQANAESYGSVEAMIAEQHRNFIFF